MSTHSGWTFYISLNLKEMWLFVTQNSGQNEHGSTSLTLVLGLETELTLGREVEPLTIYSAPNQIGRE